MMDFLVKWAINIVSLFLVIHIIAGVSVDSWGAVVTAALVLGFLNAFLRPFLFAVTLPFSIATLGLFTLLINGSMFYLAAKFVKGFTVASFWHAFWASILFSIISFILNIVFAPKPAIFYKSSSREEVFTTEKKYDDAIDVEGHVEDDEDRRD